MQIVYAPTHVITEGYILDNAIQGCDIQVLDTLCEPLESGSGGGDILYFAPNDKIAQAVLGALEDRKIRRIHSLENLQDTCCMVTTTSHIAYAYAFYYQKPVIFFLPAFKSIEVNSPQFAALNVFGIFTHSLKELKEKVGFYMHDSSHGDKIGDFLQRSLI